MNHDLKKDTESINTATATRIFFTDTEYEKGFKWGCYTALHTLYCSNAYKNRHKLPKTQFIIELEEALNRIGKNLNVNFKD